jgi:prepilin-type processing-associated H-X9-DG protein
VFTGHLATVNFLFADGHVKAMKPLATGTPVNMWTCEEDGPLPTPDPTPVELAEHWSKNLKVTFTKSQAPMIGALRI